MEPFATQATPAETDEELLIVEDDLDETSILESSVNDVSCACHWNGCTFVGSSVAELPEHVTQEHVKKATAPICEWKNCDRYDAPLASKFALAAHVRKHTGERPFKCQVADCSKAFTRSDALSKHIKINHPEESQRLASQSHQTQEVQHTSPRKRQRIRKPCVKEPEKTPTYTGPYRTMYDLIQDGSKDEKYKANVLHEYGKHLLKEHEALKQFIRQFADQSDKLEFEINLLRKHATPRTN